MMGWLNDLKPALTMVAVQFGYAGVNVFYKIAASDGMKLRVIVAYRLMFATAFIFPIAFFLESKRRPKLTWMILLLAFLCGLFGWKTPKMIENLYLQVIRVDLRGSLAQLLYLGSFMLTSATFAAALTNLVPAITFIIALSLGMEKLNFRDKRGKAKVVGALLGVCGALILIFYRGVTLNLWSTNINLLIHNHNHSPQSQAHNSDDDKNHILGSVLGIGCCISLSLWLIVQAKMSERYPCHYSGTALISAMASIQAMIYAAFTEKDWSQWKLGWNIRLLTVAYSGIVVSGLVVVVTAWCVHKKGPVFASAFNPLMMVLVAIAGSLFLQERIHLGTLIAAIVIVIGLYLLLWGKGKEIKVSKDKPMIINSNQVQSEKPTVDQSVHVIVAVSGDDEITLTRDEESVELKKDQSTQKIIN